MEKISIIIVNWNTGALLAQCLASIKALPEQALLADIIVVDNASHDHSLEQARMQMGSWEKVTFLEPGENLGFAKANNIGIQKRTDKTSHVLLLNPDTKVLPGSISALLEVLVKQPQVGIVGPVLLNADGSQQESVRGFPSLLTMIVLFLKLNRFAYSLHMLSRYFLQDFNYRKQHVVDQVMGACFLIRNRTFQQVGTLDEAFWVWFEEVDYCKRAKRQGWDTLYTPNAQVIHYGGISFHQLLGFSKTVPMLRSALHYTRKYLGVVSVTVLYFLFPVSLLLSLPSTGLHMLVLVKNKRRL